MKKILIVTNHSYMLWQFRKELIMELMKENNVVLVMPFVGHQDDFKNLGCKCIEIDVDRRGMNPLKDFKLYKSYKKILLNERPDLVITYSIKPNIYCGYACSKLGIKYFANVQGLGTMFQKEPIATIVSIMYKFALKKSKKVFFENTANSEEFIKRHIIPNDKIKVLNGAGVNLDYYKLAEYPSEENGITFLFLGRIMKEKGIDELFSAAKNIKQKYGDAVKFEIAGFFEDEYKEEIYNLENNGIIHFCGFQKDPRPLYAQSHCVILPSYHEGMSNVLLEAASTGRAIITSNIPGCREAVIDGVSGYLCEKKNYKSLEKMIEKFILLNKKTRAEMGNSGYLLMINNFDKNKVISETLAILDIPVNEED